MKGAIFKENDILSTLRGFFQTDYLEINIWELGMGIFRSALLGCSALVLTGCFWTTPTVPVNLNYVESDYGYLNAGGFRSGSLFRWLRDPAGGKGRLVYVGNLSGFGVPEKQSLKAEDYAIYKRGADIELSVDLGLEEGEINGEISKRAKFQLTNFRREKTDDYITKVSEHIVFKPATGSEQRRLRTQEEKDNILKVWRFREVERNPNHFYVLVTDVTYGDDVRLEIDNNVETRAKFVVPFLSGKVRLDLVGKDLRKISGNFTELMFGIDVLAPEWKDNGGGGQNPDFNVVTGDVVPDMPSLLREIGSPL